MRIVVLVLFLSAIVSVCEAGDIVYRWQADMKLVYDLRLRGQAHEDVFDVVLEVIDVQDEGASVTLSLNRLSPSRVSIRQVGDNEKHQVDVPKSMTASAIIDDRGKIVSTDIAERLRQYDLMDTRSGRLVLTEFIIGWQLFWSYAVPEIGYLLQHPTRELPDSVFVMQREWNHLEEFFNISATHLTQHASGIMRIRHDVEIPGSSPLPKTMGRTGKLMWRHCRSHTVDRLILDEVRNGKRRSLIDLENSEISTDVLLYYDSDHAVFGNADMQYRDLTIIEGVDGENLLSMQVHLDYESSTTEDVFEPEFMERMRTLLRGQSISVLEKNDAILETYERWKNDRDSTAEFQE